MIYNLFFFIYLGRKISLLRFEMWFKIDDFKRDIKQKFQQSFPYKLLLCTFIYHEYNRIDIQLWTNIRISGKLNIRCWKVFYVNLKFMLQCWSNFAAKIVHLYSFRLMPVYFLSPNKREKEIKSERR